MAGVEDIQLHSCYDSARSVSTRSYRPCSTHSVMVSTETIRSVAVVRTVSGDVSCVVGNRPDVVVDSAGRSWWLSQNPHGNDFMAPLLHHYTALGSAGSMCIASFLPFRELQPLLTKAISNAPCGPLSDALRSAVPVHDATGKQRRAVAELFRGHHCLEHPNLLHCNAYSLSVEGGVVLLKNFAPGGTLRDVLARYAKVNVQVLANFALGILSALSYLHANSCVHGALSLDNTMVGSDGQCRLRGFFSDYALAQETFLLPCTCYMSPAMAAGHPPTPACDVFCYGLLMLEAVCRKQPWKWTEDAQGEPYGTVEELKSLAAEGGQPFRTAVAAGRVVPDAAGFVAACVAQSVPECVAQDLLRCLSMNVVHRPTAADHWHVALRHLASFYAP